MACSHSFQFHFLVLVQLILIFFPGAVFPHADQSPPLLFLDDVVGSKLGDRQPGIASVKSYLRRYGYMPPHDSIEDEDQFDPSLQSALTTYQSNFKLSPTGHLDSATAAMMNTPRCGVPDGNSWMKMKMKMKMKMMAKSKSKRSRPSRRFRTTARYNFFPGNPRWPDDKTNWTYAFLPGTPDMAKLPISRAFHTWESHFRSRFSFARAEDDEASASASADIKIGFYSRYHGDAGSFDGPGGALAHSSQPGFGLLHFDADETWSVGPVHKGAFDVETVALHEIGHILGLMHSSVPTAIMYPAIGDGVTKNLTRDDLHGIRALYHI